MIPVYHNAKAKFKRDNRGQQIKGKKIGGKKIRKAKEEREE
jgi:hypothetical protein